MLASCPSGDSTDLFPHHEHTGLLPLSQENPRGCSHLAEAACPPPPKKKLGSGLDMCVFLLTPLVKLSDRQAQDSRENSRLRTSVLEEF